MSEEEKDYYSQAAIDARHKGRMEELDNLRQLIIFCADKRDEVAARISEQESHIAELNELRARMGLVPLNTPTRNFLRKGNRRRKEVAATVAATPRSNNPQPATDNKNPPQKRRVRFK